jgi:hypothetical protein
LKHLIEFIESIKKNLGGGYMDEKLQQLVDDVLLIERGYAYEKRSIKSQRQGEIFKEVDDFLNKYLEAQDATK